MRPTTDKLMPCPFCGGEAHIERAGHVCCKAKGCRGFGAFSNYGTHAEQTKSAIAAWNRRATRAAAEGGEAASHKFDCDDVCARCGGAAGNLDLPDACFATPTSPTASGAVDDAARFRWLQDAQNAARVGIGWRFDLRAAIGAAVAAGAGEEGE